MGCEPVLGKKGSDFGLEFVDYAGFDLALPYNQYVPTELAQPPTVRLIPCYIARKLRTPIGSVRRWYALSTTATVLVPETPMHKYDLSARREDQVGFSRKIGAMESEAVSQRMYELAYGQFRRGVLGSHLRHYAASLLRSECIHSVRPWGLVMPKEYLSEGNRPSPRRLPSNCTRSVVSAAAQQIGQGQTQTAQIDSGLRRIPPDPLLRVCGDPHLQA